jgi:hypothetical protein
MHLHFAEYRSNYEDAEPFIAKERSGVFRNYLALAELRHHNLIYGFNNVSKTTLARLFASLESDIRQPEFHLKDVRKIAADIAWAVGSEAQKAGVAPDDHGRGASRPGDCNPVGSYVAAHDGRMGESEGERNYTHE